MRTTSAAKILPTGLALVALCMSGACANAVDPKLVYGSYGVNVSAFGKTDPAIVVASEGADGAILLNFTYGFATDYGAVNATGLRAELDGSNLKLKDQPVHVDHSTGELDGMLTGIGTTGGASIALTLKVLPTNVILKDANNQPLPAGTTVDYEVDGPKQ